MKFLHEILQQNQPEIIPSWAENSRGTETKKGGAKPYGEGHLGIDISETKKIQEKIQENINEFNHDFNNSKEVEDQISAVDNTIKMLVTLTLSGQITDMDELIKNSKMDLPFVNAIQKSVNNSWPSAGSRKGAYNQLLQAIHNKFIILAIDMKPR